MKTLLAIVCLGLTIAVFAADGLPAIGQPLLLALAGAGAAEALGVRLPFYGTVSFGLVVYVPLICLSELGPSMAMVVALIALTIREVLSYSNPERLADELMLDLLPLSIAALVPTMLKGDEPELLLWLGVGLTFITTRHIGIRILSSGLAREQAETVKNLQANTAEIRWGVLGLSLLAVPLIHRSPFMALALVPVLLSLRKAAIHAYAWLDKEDKKRLRSVAGQLSQSLTKAETEISQLSSALETTESERNLLFDLSQQTANSRSLVEVLRVLERMVKSLELGSSVELLIKDKAGWVFLEQDEKGRVTSSESRFEQVGMGFKKAWKESKSCVSKNTGRAYYPLPGVGVLSVLRPSSGLDASQREAVSVFCSQAALACLSAQRFEMVERAMGQLATLNEGLRDRNQALVNLTRHLRELSACKGIEEACEKLPQTGILLFGELSFAGVSLEKEGQRVFAWTSPTRPRGELQYYRAPLDENHQMVMAAGQVDNTPHDEEVLGVGFQCTREIISQILLSLSLQEALEQLRSSEAKLIQSAKLAAVGQLSAGLAHEINNPLGSIRLAIEITLRKEQLGDFSKDLMEKALKGVERAQNIIGSLLTYSRSGAKGKIQVSAWDVTFDACSFVAATLRVEDVQLMLPEKGEEAMVLANPQELQQIITNLVLNAKDAVAGQQEAKVQVVASHTGSGEFRVEVHDNGPGVPDGVKERVFDPFFTTKPVGKGTGLGLSVSRELAEAQDGRLELEVSSVLGGACFVLTLPLSR